MEPVCKNCGDSGKGAEFSLSSEHGFGTFCVKCEELISPEALRVCKDFLTLLPDGASLVAAGKVDRGGE